MRQERRQIVTLVSTLLLCSSVLAQSRGPARKPARPAVRSLPQLIRNDPLPPTQEQQEAKAFRSLQYKGKKLRRDISKVTRKLKWHKTLAAAQKQAVRSGKPILWIHALGKLSGYT